MPVYPIAHWGSHHILPTYGSKFRPGFWKRVEVTVGNEIDLTEYRNKKLTPEQLQKSVEIIRSRVDALGVSEPEIRTLMTRGFLWAAR